MLGKSLPQPSTTAAGGPSLQHPDLMIAQALNQALVGERKSISSWNGSAATLRSWLKLLALWEFESQIPLDKRGVKLLQSFPEGSQPRRVADTVPTQILLSSGGYRAILTALYEKYAPFLEASGPQAIDKLLFEGERGRNESFSAFIAAKELARQEMESQLGETISEKLCGRILLKQANLTEVQRELVMLSGPALRSFSEVASMLRPLDRPEMLARSQEPSAGKNFYTVENDFEDYDEVLEDEDASESSLEDPNGNAYLYLDDREYDEDEAVAVFAYHSAYRDARRELQKRRNERGYTAQGQPARTRRASSTATRP